MSEKNGEIAKDLDAYLARYGGMKPKWFDGSSLSWLTVAEDVAYLMHIFKESLKAKDRDHEAMIGVLVGEAISLKEDVERLMGLLAKEPTMQNKAKWDDIGQGCWYRIRRLNEALSHPLVQEYLKKEKKP